MLEKIINGTRQITYYILGNILGRIMYNSEFFPKGRWFSNWRSQGWKWVIADFWGRIFLKQNKGVKFPCSPFSVIGGNGNAIKFDVNDLDNFHSPNCYFQVWDAQIHIGQGTYIAPGVGIITSNHDVYDLDKRRDVSDVHIGKCCWIGMNAIILPGVTLGDHTIVGAGSVVTKSFSEGYRVIGGNPAKTVKLLDKEECRDNNKK